MKTDPVHATLLKISQRLEGLQVPYAVCGAMALSAQGFVRATVDVDLLLSRSGHRTVLEQLSGLGFLPPFAGSKNLVDAETTVRVEFLITGGFPGDGKPKPVAFPDPAAPGVAELIDGVSYLSLPTLIELKLASGMTAPHRARDIVDVQSLIEIRKLPREFAEQLNPYVREKFVELWQILRDSPRPEWEEPSA